MEEYIAHKEGDRIQSVKEHLTGTAELAGSFAAKFGKEEWGYCCGMLHDIGKYSKEFQRKIKEDTNERVDHATAGAQLCKELGGYYPILSYCIAGHHAGLPDYGNTAISSSLCGRLKKKICDYQVYSKEIQIPELRTDPVLFDPNKNTDFALSTFIRMIYSCLVDADFLDTEAFMKNGDTGRESGETMSALLKKLNNRISDWLENTEIDTINGRRTEILKHCIEMGNENKGIFRLTVPTGGGKTMASLAFAIHHAVKHNMDRIIYVIPYTSIIEQNAQVFREFLGDKNVLENHCNVEFADTEEFRPMQLASENWDKPVVVTTNVQFFESVFGNKSSKCRKIHNIANSVIIFDEAQMLPENYLKPCVAMLQELVDSYETSIVLCTATQPTLDVFFTGSKSIKELCSRVEEQFRFFKRVKYEKLGEMSLENLLKRIERETNTLCIVNTKKLAQEIYKELRGEGVYHLSTAMYPKHRKRVLRQIKGHLKNYEKCIVISTSLVEAGVDLDFSSVYRQTAGIDSIIQAAGRCNREGKSDTEESKVYIFDLEGSKADKNQRQQMDVARGILKDYEDIAELNAITDYFSRLYHYYGSSLDKKNIMGEFQKMNYNFKNVGKEFKLIEQTTKTIFINKEPEVDALLQELKRKGVSKERIRKAGQYCIQIYYNENDKNQNKLFNYLYDRGMIKEISEDMQDYYELVDLEKYSEEYGLDLSVDSDEILIM